MGHSGDPRKRNTSPQPDGQSDQDPWTPETLPPLPPKWGQPQPATDGAWTVRITFAWTGPARWLDPLRTLAHCALEDLGGGEYAWTVLLAGDVGPGTNEEREGRAMSIVQDLLAAMLGESLGEDDDPAQYFTHHSTEHVPGDGHD